MSIIAAKQEMPLKGRKGRETMDNGCAWYHYLISNYGREYAFKIITEYLNHIDKNDIIFASELIKAINQDKNNNTGKAGTNNGK